MLQSVVAVGGGAALGAWLRWGLSVWLNPVFPTIPFGTLASNIGGGLMMGIAMSILGHYQALAPEVRLLMTTGFLGGLTTFSTFSGEATTLITRGQYGWTAAYIALHVVGSIAATIAGIALTDWILAGRAS